MSDSYTDQTQFMEQEPLYEQPVKPELPKPPLQQAPEPVPKKKSPKVVFILAGLVFFIVLLLLIVLISMTRTKKPPATEDEVDEAQEQMILGPFTQRLEELQAQLDAADPLKEELPLPPVDMEIELE